MTKHITHNELNQMIGMIINGYQKPVKAVLAMYGVTEYDRHCITSIKKGAMTREAVYANSRITRYLKRGGQMVWVPGSIIRPNFTNVSGLISLVNTFNKG